MNREESLGPSAVFELGEPNDAYAKYFIIETVQSQ